MDDALIKELRQSAARDAKAYARLKAVTDAAPEAKETADEREIVMVRMGSDGLPERILFAADWREYCPTDQLAAAVMNAVTRATEAVAGAWADALPDEQTLAAAEAAPPSDGDDPVKPSPEPRRVDELAESVIEQLNAAIEASQDTSPKPEEVVGEDRARRVRLALSPAGMTDCRIDTGWARSQSAARLGQAFQQALRDGKSQLLELTQTDLKRMRQTDQALSEVLAHVSNRSDGS
jgi:hypothetical protein